MARVDLNAMTINYTTLAQTRYLICLIYFKCISQGIVHTNLESPNNKTNYFYFLMGFSHLEKICNAVKKEAREKCGKENTPRNMLIYGLFSHPYTA